MKWIKNFLTVANSSIVVLIMFFTKFNPIGYIEKYLPQELITRLNDPTVRITINTAIMLLLVQGIITLFSKPVSLNTNINNLDGTPFTDIPIGNSSQKPKKLNLDVKINYRNKFLKWLIGIFGGLYIFLDNTTWTSIEAEKNSPLFLREIDDNTTNEYIRINIHKFLGKSELKKSFRINLNVLSNSPDPMPGTLYVDFDSKNRNIFIKFIFGRLINYDKCSHYMQSSREVV